MTSVPFKGSDISPASLAYRAVVEEAATKGAAAAAIRFYVEQNHGKPMAFELHAGCDAGELCQYLKSLGFESEVFLSQSGTVVTAVPQGWARVR